MKLPISWLKDFVDYDLSAEKLAEKLTMAGMEVESIEAPFNFEKVVIGEVLEVRKHPNADKLNVAQVKVQAKGKEALQIVCGAPNLAKGQKVPVALVGAKLADFEIGQATLRGVESSGMICSEKELGLGEDHAGIMVLKSNAPVGKDFAEYLGGEKVIDIKIFANRPDLMGIVGLAREAAAVLNKKLELEEISFKENVKSKTEDSVEVEVADVDLCPRYVARAVKGIKIKPSPEWMQKRLIACGVRPINNIVDISNYVMLEYGQPLHIFDLDTIKKEGKKAKIVVRRAKKGEEIETLDGTKRKLTTDMLVIADVDKPIAVAGVMGGANTEVGEKTKNVLIEAAVFDKASIRRTSRALGLRSEAVARFEKGIPLPTAELGTDRCAELLVELAGGEVCAGKIDILSKYIWLQHIGLHVSKLKKFLGIEITAKEVVEILERLEIDAVKFDIIKEAKKHLGKPYLWGANYKQNGTDAFDCGYLVDYIYSLVGHMVGHTAPQILEYGKEVALDELKPGDVLFRNGKWEKVKEKDRNGVSHVAMYIGDGKIIHAEDHHRVDGEWIKYPVEEQKVRIDPLEIITEDPHYIKATRLVENLEDYIAVDAPWWRPDLKTETDLYEEIIRIWGYDRLPSTLPETGARVPQKNLPRELSHQIRKLLSDIGVTEILTYSFIGKKEIEAVGVSADEAPKVANPLVSEQEYLRPTLLPHMLMALAENQFNRDDLSLFEIGRTFRNNKSALLPKEEKCLVIGVIGEKSWPINYGENNNFYNLKGVFERISDELNLYSQKIEFKKYKDQTFAAGKSAEVYINNKPFARLGEVAKPVLNSFGVKRAAAIMEINLEVVEKFANESKVFDQFSKYPKVTRDISAIFEKSVEVGNVVKGLTEVDKLIHQVQIIDIYEGRPLDKTEKSVTIRLEFWSKEKTLTDAEVDAIIIKCMAKVKNLGGKIRGEQE